MLRIIDEYYEIEAARLPVVTYGTSLRDLVSDKLLYVLIFIGVILQCTYSCRRTLEYMVFIRRYGPAVEPGAAQAVVIESGTQISDHGHAM